MNPKIESTFHKKSLISWQHSDTMTYNKTGYLANKLIKIKETYIAEKLSINIILYINNFQEVLFNLIFLRNFFKNLE
jgi:hypothetical protein